MNKIPTAEEFFKEDMSKPTDEWIDGYIFCTPEKVIEFVRLHVQAALKAAANQEERVGRCEFIVLNESQKNLVMNAYPNELIK